VIDYVYKRKILNVALYRVNWDGKTAIEVFKGIDSKK